MVILWNVRRQCFFFSRNIGLVTPGIMYLYYQKKYFLDQRIQRIHFLVLRQEALFNSIGSVCVCDAGIFENLELGRLSTVDVLALASMRALHSLGPMQKVFETLLEELTRVGRTEELLSGNNWQQILPLAMQLSAKPETSLVRV